MRPQCIFWDRCEKERDPFGLVNFPERIRKPVFLPCSECMALMRKNPA